MFDALLNRLRPKRRKAPNPRKTSEPKLLGLPGTSLEFHLQRDFCRTLRLTVKPDGSVLVKAPARVPLNAILDFVRSRLVWIDEKREFFLRHRGEGIRFENDGIIFFAGKPFRLKLIPAHRGEKPLLIRGQLELPCRSESSEDVEAAFKAWRLSLAKQVLTRRLARLETKARIVFGDGAAVSGITVRSLKRRWGSCSVRGEITLAAQLVELPLPLIDYVICHELCHLRRMDHSPAFRTALTALLPEARERERLIRIWSLEHPRI